MLSTNPPSAFRWNDVIQIHFPPSRNRFAKTESGDNVVFVPRKQLALLWESCLVICLRFRIHSSSRKRCSATSIWTKTVWCLHLRRMQVLFEHLENRVERERKEGERKRERGKERTSRCSFWNSVTQHTRSAMHVGRYLLFWHGEQLVWCSRCRLFCFALLELLVFWEREPNKSFSRLDLDGKISFKEFCSLWFMCVDVISELKQRGIKQATASALEILKELKGGADTAYQARQNVLQTKNINILQTALDLELNGEASCTKYTYLYVINMRKRVHSFLQVRG